MIREYKDGEIKSLVSIYNECFSTPSQELLNTILDFDAKILVYGEHPYAFGMIVGIIDEKEPWIWTVAVRPDWQGYGIATELIKALEIYYEGYDKINLFVNTDNPAQKLYFDLGYRVVKVVKDIYENRDALKMVKKLSS